MLLLLPTVMAVKKAALNWNDKTPETTFSRMQRNKYNYHYLQGEIRSNLSEYFGDALNGRLEDRTP